MSKILKMSAPWCNPCKLMDLQMVRLGDQIDVVIEHVNIDENSIAANTYNIRSIPTLIKLNDAGEEVNRVTGSLTDAKLLEFLL